MFHIHQYQLEQPRLLSSFAGSQDLMAEVKLLDTSLSILRSMAVSGIVSLPQLKPWQRQENKDMS